MPPVPRELALTRIAQKLTGGTEHDRQLLFADLEALDQRMCAAVAGRIELLIRVTVAAKEIHKPKYVRIRLVADDPVRVFVQVPQELATSIVVGAQATVTLVHPKDKDDTPIIEIYFEKPNQGRPGKAYAFRAAMETKDGPDYIRFRKDFEGAWNERFDSQPATPRCDDEAGQVLRDAGSVQHEPSRMLP